MIKKNSILLILLSIYFCVLYFINFNVNNLDLRFYTSKDNGLFSYFEITFLTIFFAYVILFRNLLVAILISFLFGLISFASIYLLLSFDNFIYLFTLWLIISLLPAIVFIYLGLKKNSFLNIDFKYLDILYIILYIVVLEITLQCSMDTTFKEVITYLL